MAEKAPVALAISTAEEERQRVSIDGVEYELATSEDLSLRDQLWLARAGKQIKAATEGEATDAELDELQEAVNRMTRLSIPRLPDGVFGRLKDKHKLAIVMAFIGAAALTAGETRPPGTPSLPDSSDSTEAIVQDGLTPQSPPSDVTSSK